MDYQQQETGEMHIVNGNINQFKNDIKTEPTILQYIKK